MDVVRGIEVLRQTAAQLGDDLPLDFPTASSALLAEVAHHLRLSAELEEAYRYGAPAGDFPSFVQLSELWAPDSLVSMHVGYSRLASGEAIDGWEPGWIVIGYDAGDPFIAHADQPGTPVSVAISGEGSWTPAPVADSLGSFYALIAAWSALIIEDFDGSRTDDDHDYAIKDGFWAAFERRLGPVIPLDHIAALRAYLET